MDAIAIIEKLGGIRPTATKLSVAISTVQGWKERNKIPEKRMSEIYRLIDVDDIKKPANLGVPYNSRAEKPKVFTVNTANVENGQKNYASGKLFTLVLSVAMLALVVSVAIPIWQESRDAEYKQQIPMIGENATGIKLLSQSVQDSLKNTDNRDAEIIEQVNINRQAIKNVGVALSEFKQQTQQKLGSFNEQLVLMRQISTLGLLGEPYSVLLGSYGLTENQTKNKNLTEALSVLKTHKNGVRTMRYLRSYITDNARSIAPTVSERIATTLWGKVKAKLESLVHIRRFDISADTLSTSIALDKILITIDNNDLQSGIEMAKSYNIKSLNNWANMAQNRLDMTNALIVLLGVK